MVLAYPDEKSFIAKIAYVAWLKNAAYTGEYNAVLSQHFEKIELKNGN